MKRKIWFCMVTAVAMCFAFAGCGGEDAGQSGEEELMEIQITAGEENIVEAGEYAPIELDASMSGTPESPTVIKAAEGATPVIKVKTGEIQSGEDDMDEAFGIHMTDVENVVVEGFAIEGGTRGIYYESTRDRGDSALSNITIKNCSVSGVVGAHGICVYARNDLAPVTGLTIDGCEVKDCKCGDSESLVLNGNVDGFVISNNTIHDNNNIGIDMIGFEGTAKHPKGEGFENRYDVDYARNGQCFGNVVYNISADGNPAYFYDGEYDLCADGIYVDGGQNIEIYNNFIYSCDIGIEVATEHSPDDNELFKVSDIKVHDNVVAGCEGWCGLCFGGYDKDLGFTEDCEFCNNTFIDNGTQIGVQRSKNNSIHDNLFVGGDSCIEFNTDCREGDMVNNFGSNVWCVKGSLEDYIEVGDYDIETLMPGGAVEAQKVLHKRGEVIDGVKSLVDGVGSGFVPDDKEVAKWQK